MGTSWSLLAVAPPPDAAEQVQAALDRVVAQMSQWERDSNISLFNRGVVGQWHTLPPEFASVLNAALAIREASGGAFDPAMGALADLWGFGTAPRPASCPDQAMTDAILAQRGGVEIDAPLLCARRTGQARLDFSAIAKGFGVDLAADRLRAGGLRDFLLEVGGELRGEGVKPDGQPWWVELEAPPNSDMRPMRIALHGLAIATSGDYRRWLDIGGKRHAHTLDPRTGRPVEHGVRSVTVLHQSCMMADAWATALTVLGPVEGPVLAETQGLVMHMLSRENGETMSPALLAMLD